MSSAIVWDLSFLSNRSTLRSELKSLLKSSDSSTFSRKALELLKQGDDLQCWITFSDQRLTNKVIEKFNLSYPMKINSHEQNAFDEFKMQVEKESSQKKIYQLPTTSKSINIQSKANSSLWKITALTVTAVAAIVLTLVFAPLNAVTPETTVHRCTEIYMCRQINSQNPVVQAEITKQIANCDQKMPPALENLIKTKLTSLQTAEECLSIKNLIPAGDIYNPVSGDAYRPHRIAHRIHCSPYEENASRSSNAQVFIPKFVESYNDKEEACALLHRFLPQYQNKGDLDLPSMLLRQHQYNKGAARKYAHSKCYQTSVANDLKESYKGWSEM